MKIEPHAGNPAGRLEIPAMGKTDIFFDFSST